VARWPLVLNAEPEAAADEHTKQEIMALYRELAKLVMERVAEGGGNG
jgi:ABC-type lipoprotein export system ATPase subunit